MDATNDGLWHAYEVRSKRDLTNNSLGAFQVWIDGVLRINLDPVNAGNAPISFINFCYRNGSVPTDTHIVFDEVVISNQYIGLLGASFSATAP